MQRSTATALILSGALLISSAAAGQPASTSDDCRKTGSCAGSTKPGGVENSPMTSSGGTLRSLQAPSSAPPAATQAAPSPAPPPAALPATPPDSGKGTTKSDK